VPPSVPSSGAQYFPQRVGGGQRPGDDRHRLTDTDGEHQRVQERRWYIDAGPFADPIDAEFPLFGQLEISGMRVKGLGGTAKLVSADGTLDVVARGRLARHLAERFASQEQPVVDRAC
jgi:hypothetical protein